MGNAKMRRAAVAAKAQAERRGGESPPATQVCKRSLHTYSPIWQYSKKLATWHDTCF
jgi:hypothetical protein